MISTNTGTLTRLGTPYYIVKALKKAGFKSYDFTMNNTIIGFDSLFDSDDYRQRAKDFKVYTDKLGIYCNQTHGYVPRTTKGATLNDRKDNYEKIKRTIEITKILGAKYCVLHPDSFCTMNENIDFFKSLKELAHENDVVIAIENMPNDNLFGKPEDLITLLNGIDDSYFQACLDIGHAEIAITGSTALDFITKLGTRIVCLHIHDNDKGHDLHQLPFTNGINFFEIFKALKENKYEGDITFESDIFQRMSPTLFVDAISFIREIGEYITTLIR